MGGPFDASMDTHHNDGFRLKWIGWLSLRYRASRVAWQGKPAPRSVSSLNRSPLGPVPELRDDLISELHKLKSISIADSESKADAILGGGGEVWIAGYRSLNPRAGTSPSHGSPVYSGYLSVELRDPKGETLWSDLVTPGAASEDVSKELSKRDREASGRTPLTHGSRAGAGLVTLPR